MGRRNDNRTGRDCLLEPSNEHSGEFGEVLWLLHACLTASSRFLSSFSLSESVVPVIPSPSPAPLTAPRWLASVGPPRLVPILREDHSGVRVRYRSHHVQVSIVHSGPAYLGEEFPIEINVTNGDDKELDVVVDVLLQPTEIDEAGSSPPLPVKQMSLADETPHTQ